MIWGMTLEPGQAQTEVIVGEIQLSMATMESRGCLGAKSDSFSHVVMRTSTAEYLLCTLVSGVTYQQNLDLKLMPNDKVTFSVQGTNVVYLTGYSYMPSEVMMDEAEAGVQADDWIEEANLDASVPQDDSGDFSGMDSSYFPAMNQEDHHPHEREDEEKYSVEYSEDRDQYQPETDERVQTSDSSGNMMDPSLTSESKQTAQELIDNAGVELVDVKEEIHTIVDTTEDEPTQQTGREDRGQTINLPSTSTGHPVETNIESSTPFQFYDTHPDLRVRNTVRGEGGGGGGGFIQRGLKSQQTQFRPTVVPSSVNYSLIPYSKNYHPQSAPGTEMTKVKTLYHTSNRKTHWDLPVGRSAEIGFRRGSKIRTGSKKRSLDPNENFKCKFCGKIFVHEGALLKHERIHTGERPYQCRLCLKTFRVQDSLKKHLRTHTGERPYTCELCGRTFIQNSHLRVHQGKHHNRIPVKSRQIPK